jgi:uncharacterized protein YgbK (DUF1537 family)
LNGVREVDLLASLPSEHRSDLSPLIDKELRTRRDEVVLFLEDDSTGVQMSHDVYLVLDHSVDGMREGVTGALAADHRLVFVLTNSRALSPGDAEEVTRTTAENLHVVAEDLGIRLRFGSRSDSTLRGHFPLEPLTLMRVLQDKGQNVDGVLVSHAFLTEMRRITVHGVHMLRTVGDDGSYWYTPVHLTKFAQDRLFHYPTSNMAQYVAYKFAASGLGTVMAQDVLHIDIEAVRVGGPDAVETRLMDAENGRVVVVDVVSPRDLQVLVLALLRAEGKGKHFVYRTAASFPPARVNMSHIPVLEADQLGIPRRGGQILCLWGSIVDLSTDQLFTALKTVPNLEGVPFDVAKVLAGKAHEAVEASRRGVEAAFQRQNHAVVYTVPRHEYPATELNPASRAENHQAIAFALQQVYDRARVSPDALVFKGGTTSSVGLFNSGAKKVYVLGQIAPGIPVVKILPSDNVKIPGREVLLVLGPGNVGVSDTYVQIVNTLTTATL